MSTQSASYGSSRKTLPGLGIFVLLAVMSLVWVTIRITSNQPPTPDQIRNWPAIQPFLIEPSQIEGHYRILDIDSLVFTYTTGETAADGFWETVTSQATEKGWRELEGEGEASVFERVYPQGPDGWWIAEQVRMRMNAENRRVAVAWVRADSTVRVERFDETKEARWAEAEVWPQVSSLAAGRE